jgi:hypothetical protein
VILAWIRSERAGIIASLAESIAPARRTSRTSVPSETPQRPLIERCTRLLNLLACAPPPPYDAVPPSEYWVVQLHLQSLCFCDELSLQASPNSNLDSRVKRRRRLRYLASPRSRYGQPCFDGDRCAFAVASGCCSGDSLDALTLAGALDHTQESFILRVLTGLSTGDSIHPSAPDRLQRCSVSLQQLRSARVACSGTPGDRVSPAAKCART